MQFHTKNKIIIITAPSGAGKTSITRYLLAKYPELSFSISAATRSPRGTERNGVEYYFMDVETFQKHIRHNDFVEWEMVYEGKYYGTLKSELTRIWDNNQVPMLDIDVKGAIHVQQQYPQSTLSLFIEPPSVEELRRRLESRGTETPESLNDRVNKASFEISFKHHFDHIIVNDDLDKACSQAESIIVAFLLQPSPESNSNE
ncbi:guanylate kinase [Flavihumibacter rivuli]|uniref:guanylate kinase n=1 Tax=Flavihumibacter rivuli TaxID=2838156 RepID=UPI001BDDD8D0|nr:guanylate kinase [Flavihumibacter rivuli]ULQ56087.1 guanylate kinase [Flavihumibacter rivuli]